MLNEPFGDEALQISPLYEDVAARIRKHDEKAILFIEPQVLPRTPACSFRARLQSCNGLMTFELEATRTLTLHSWLSILQAFNRHCKERLSADHLQTLSCLGEEQTSTLRESMQGTVVKMYLQY